MAAEVMVPAVTGLEVEEGVLTAKEGEARMAKEEAAGWALAKVVLVAAAKTVAVREAATTVATAATEEMALVGWETEEAVEKALARAVAAWVGASQVEATAPAAPALEVVDTLAVA